MRNLLASALLGCVIMLGGCGASSSGAQTDDVQDIHPGEKSVIQPPQANTDNGAPRIEERNI